VARLSGTKLDARQVEHSVSLREIERDQKTQMITGSLLYNLVACPHRVYRDLFTDPSKRDPDSKFVQLLWERGTAFEAEVIASLGLPFINLSDLSSDERERRTDSAMAEGAPLIYGGRIRVEDLLGEPDLLRKVGAGYVAGDIKSGAGDESVDDDDNKRPKKHYAVQLALYTDILEKKGISAGRNPFIWDVHREEIVYHLDEPQSGRNSDTLWNFYQAMLAEARRIIAKEVRTLPALAAVCNLCHWRTACMQEVKTLDDLTLITELGRARRDGMLPYIRSVADLAQADADSLIRDHKSIIPGFGPDMLARFQERARLQKSAKPKPYLRERLDLPVANTELFFDIEVDPMRDICYLHGFLESCAGNGAQERYVSFLAETPTEEQERQAFTQAFEYVQSKMPCVIYYYSKYERTWWRKLQKRYPSVASEDAAEAIFEKTTAVDLYSDIVRPLTVWPTYDHSIKTLATYLDFKWRDVTASGAESIEWYHRWVESGDEAIRQRILEYNEDDCRSTRVLLDGIRSLLIGPSS